MKISPTKRITFVDVFAGCGGLSVGLFEAGLAGKFAIEHDKFAFASLQENLLSSHAKHKFDWSVWLPKKQISIGTLLKDFRPQLKELEGTIDVLVGGPPCQGFSSAGRRRHDDPRNQLFASYLDLVEVLKPKAVLIENVRGFTMNFDAGGEVKNYAHKLRSRLSQSYSMFEELIDVSQFGVPQQRTRYFVLAVQPGFTDLNPFARLREKRLAFLRSLNLTAPVSSSAAISDLEIARGGTMPSTDTPGFKEIKYLKPLTRYQKLMNEGVDHPKDLRLARHSERIVARFLDIIASCHSEGRLNTSISEAIRARHGILKRALRVLDPDRPSPTITSLPDDLLHYSEPRTLTVRENARLQSFPDWYSFKGKYTTGGERRRKEVPRFTQVANAVPPLMARAIGEVLIELFATASEAGSFALPLPLLNRVQEVSDLRA